MAIEDAPGTDERTIVLLGNPNPQHQERYIATDQDGKLAIRQRSVKAPHLEQSVTRVEMRPDFDDPDHVELTLSTDNDRYLELVRNALPDEHRPYVIGVYEVEHLMVVHGAGAKPDWVWSSDPDFARALAAHFNCPLGEPVALLTNAGRDALHAQHLGTSAQPAAFNYGALTANSAVANATDTTLTAEIATGGGGLVRGQMTYAHTTGTNTSTLTKTWTANGSDALPVVLAKWANFNASSSGTMGEEDLLSATATLNVVGDSTTVTFTLTAG